jgi:tetratricopeptide (TPR) repeat protein
VKGIDAGGCRVTGATPAALQAYEQALAAFQSWRNGAHAHLAAALQEAPAFVMAHVLQAWLLMCSRDPRSVQSARPVLARASALPANERERRHLGAIEATLADDYELAKARLGELLHLQPRDALALQVAHAFDYATGDLERIAERVAAVLPAWSRDLPGYHAVLAMHAFGLEESGEYERAEEAARAALDLNAADARAHHVMAHVFDMTGRADAGVRWMGQHAASWGIETMVATHGWWHVALFHLALDQPERALALYDQSLAASSAIADLIDGASLLWRIHLRGGHPGARWVRLAQGWAAHIDDGFCSFNDVHAMLAFVGANDHARAQRLEQALARAQSHATRYGRTTRDIGLPACRALMAYGRGDDALAVTRLASLPAQAHRLGGSHAQRDVLYLTMLQAIERMRRSVRRPRLDQVTVP